MGLFIRITWEAESESLGLSIEICILTDSRGDSHGLNQTQVYASRFGTIDGYCAISKTALCY